MLLPELEKLLKEIDVRIGKKYISNRIGSSASRKSGRGMDFKESRPYVIGDDIRHIDWNVSSRMNELFVKEYHQENDRTVNVFLDCSSSMFTEGAGRYSRFYLGWQLASFFSLLFYSLGDRIRIIAYSSKPEYVTEILKTRSSIFSVMKKISSFKDAGSSTEHQIPFHFIQNRLKGRNLNYIISDFLNMTSLNTSAGLHQEKEIYGIRVTDPIDTVPAAFFRFFDVRNPESGNSGIFQDSFAKDSRVYKETFLNNSLELKTDQDLAPSLIRFFSL